MASTPRIGDIVHYTSYGTPGGEYEPECRAAIVTELFPDNVSGLCVLSPKGTFFNVSPWDEEQRGGTWHYICAPRA